MERSYAPGLAGMASVLPASVLDNLLQHHSTQMKNGNMPPTNMSASTRKAIIALFTSVQCRHRRTPTSDLDRASVGMIVRGRIHNPFSLEQPRLEDACRFSWDQWAA